MNGYIRGSTSFANPVRISGKFADNHATFSPHKIQAFPTAYNLRTKSAKSTGSERIGPQREILGLFPAWPVNRSTPKTPGFLPQSGRIGWAERADHFKTGGGGATRYRRSLADFRGASMVSRGDARARAKSSVAVRTRAKGTDRMMLDASHRMPNCTTTRSSMAAPVHRDHVRTAEGLAAHRHRLRRLRHRLLRLHRPRRHRHVRPR